MTTILLLRHGETALNAAGVLRGRLEAPLNERGVAEAKALAQRVVTEYRVDKIVSSPLGRARATAQEVSRCTGVGVEVDESFQDIDYGDFAGRQPASFSAEQRAALDAWIRDPSVPLPGAEDPRTTQERSIRGLERLGSEDGVIAVVTHDAVLQVILCRLLGLELRTYRGINQHTATLNELEYSDGQFHITLLNSTWHLAGLDDTL